MRFQDVYIIMKFEKCTDVRLKLVLSSQKTYSFDIFLLDNDAKDVVLSQQYHHFFVRPLRKNGPDTYLEYDIYSVNNLSILKCSTFCPKEA